MLPCSGALGRPIVDVARQPRSSVAPSTDGGAACSARVHCAVDAATWADALPVAEPSSTLATLRVLRRALIAGSTGAGGVCVSAASSSVTAATIAAVAAAMASSTTSAAISAVTASLPHELERARLPPQAATSALCRALRPCPRCGASASLTARWHGGGLRCLSTPGDDGGVPSAMLRPPVAAAGASGESKTPSVRSGCGTCGVDGRLGSMEVSAALAVQRGRDDASSLLLLAQESARQRRREQIRRSG